MTWVLAGGQGSEGAEWIFSWVYRKIFRYIVPILFPMSAYPTRDSHPNRRGGFPKKCSRHSWSMVFNSFVCLKPNRKNSFFTGDRGSGIRRNHLDFLLSGPRGLRKAQGLYNPHIIYFYYVGLPNPLKKEEMCRRPRYIGLLWSRCTMTNPRNHDSQDNRYNTTILVWTVGHWHHIIYLL